MTFAADDARLSAMHGYEAWAPHEHGDSACRPWYPPGWCTEHAGRLRALSESFRRVSLDVQIDHCIRESRRILFRYEWETYA